MPKENATVLREVEGDFWLLGERGRAVRVLEVVGGGLVEAPDGAGICYETNPPRGPRPDDLVATKWIDDAGAVAWGLSRTVAGHQWIPRTAERNAHLEAGTFESILRPAGSSWQVAGRFLVAAVAFRPWRDFNGLRAMLDVPTPDGKPDMGRGEGR